MASYIALLRKDERSDYSVDFPDFPGCITAGTTLDVARRRAAEALLFHIDGMLADGEAIPAPSDIGAIMADPGNRDAVAVLIDGPRGQARSIRVNVMLPEDLVKSIDSATTNRSRFLADAARAKLKAEEESASF